MSAETVLKPITVTIADAIAVSRLSRDSIYKIINAGKIVTRKHGRRTLIDYASLEAYLNNLPGELSNHTQKATEARWS